MNAKTLVAGATGIVGFEVVQLLHARQSPFRTLSQSAGNSVKLQPFTTDIRVADATAPEGLVGVCDGIEVVISCLGASVTPSNRSRKSFFSVDYLANLNLLEVAKASGVKRFIYVSVFTRPDYAQTDYIRAHEAFVEALKSSGLGFTIVRPTGIFAALAEFVKFADSGLIPLIGSGESKSNPVHESDVALACCDAIDGGPEEIDIGGPDILTRKEIGSLAFAAVGKHERFIHIPRSAMLLGASAIRLFHRRFGDLFNFVARVSTTDCVATSRGSRRLKDYFVRITES